MKRFLIISIGILLAIIITEILYLFFIIPKKNLPQKNGQIEYMPVRNYAGTVISFQKGNGDYLYTLRYMNSIENIEKTMHFNSYDASIATIEYFDAQNNLLKNENGIREDIFQSGDKFDIIVNDHKQEVVTSVKNSRDIIVDEILIKVYK